MYQVIRIVLCEEEIFERDVNNEKRLAVQRSGGKVSWTYGIARILWLGKGQCWWSSPGGGVGKVEWKERDQSLRDFIDH